MARDCKPRVDYISFRNATLPSLALWALIIGILYLVI